MGDRDRGDVAAREAQSGVSRLTAERAEVIRLIDMTGGERSLVESVRALMDLHSKALRDNERLTGELETAREELKLVTSPRDSVGAVIEARVAEARRQMAAEAAGLNREEAKRLREIRYDHPAVFILQAVADRIAALAPREAAQMTTYCGGHIDRDCEVVRGVGAYCTCETPAEKAAAARERAEHEAELEAEALAPREPSSLREDHEECGRCGHAAFHHANFGRGECQVPTGCSCFEFTPMLAPREPSLPWQPIETAPKDGRWVCGWDLKHQWRERPPFVGVRWRDGLWLDKDGTSYGNLTHWTPMPVAPRE